VTCPGVNTSTVFSPIAATVTTTFTTLSLELKFQGSTPGIGALPFAKKHTPTRNSIYKALTNFGYFS
jgi:hypothetical protein